MKWLLTLLLLIPLLSFGQRKVVTLKSIQPEYITVNVDSTASSVVYYIFPPPAGINSNDRTAISTTAPTSASAQAKNLVYNASGALTVAAVIDSVTAQESDSFYAYIQTLIYDETKAGWYRSTNDTLFLDFNTAGTYTGTSIDYLNWTHGSCYTADVGGSIMPGAGFALTVGAVMNETSGADLNAYISFWWER
jgi:hypothetical protein